MTCLGSPLQKRPQFLHCQTVVSDVANPHPANNAELPCRHETHSEAAEVVETYEGLDSPVAGALDVDVATPTGCDRAFVVVVIGYIFP